METATESPQADAAAVAWPIEVRPNGTVIYDGIAIGGLSLDDSSPRLTLNLGWLRLAGVGIVVQDDPTVDHHRDGIVLDGVHCLWSSLEPDPERPRTLTMKTEQP